MEYSKEDLMEAKKQPRAHQTVAWVDEPGTMPSEPGNGCVIISKKTSAAPIHPDYAQCFFT